MKEKETESRALPITQKEIKFFGSTQLSFLLPDPFNYGKTKKMSFTVILYRVVREKHPIIKNKCKNVISYY